MNNIVEIELQGEIFKGKLDMMALASVQREMIKAYDKKFTMQDIFESITEQQFDVVVEIVVQSILRCQKVKRHLIENKLGLDNMDVVFKYITDLIEVSMPAPETGKQIEE